jgi:CubicO group peptidase (beta-lactamase class C family)
MTSLVSLVFSPDGIVLTRILAGTTAFLAAATTSLAAQRPNDSTRAQLDRVFAQWSPKDGPGCSAAASLDGKTVYEAGYGSANLEADVPITPASIFHAASVSKQFTAMAVMLLAHEGKLSLDADVRTYLPELPDYGHRITLRHLLTHTSGLRDQWDLIGIARGRFEENRITQDDVLDIVTRQTALNFVPGTEYLYSNTGYTLAAIIVGRAAGTPLRQFADERIFKPLGMTHTHFHDEYTMIVKGRTSAYARRADGGWRVSIPNFDTYGATSLFTTVGDLLTWQENFRHPVVGDQTLLREMQTSAVLANGDTTGYGLGLAIEGTGVPGALLVGHSGADAGYRSYTGRYPERGLAVAVLCNASTADPAGLAARMSAVYLKNAPKPATAPVAAAVKPTARELSRFAGLYVNPVTANVTYLSVRGDDLIVGRTNGPALVPIADRRFWLQPQRTEWAFAPNGDVVVTFRGSPPRHPVTLVRREPARPSRADLARYAGAYRSEELGATYAVSATDTALSLRTGITDPWTAVPAYGDTFLGRTTVEFTRDASNRVTGLLMSTGRVRKIRFEKVQ